MNQEDGVQVQARTNIFSSISFGINTPFLSLFISLSPSLPSLSLSSLFSINSFPSPLPFCIVLPLLPPTQSTLSPLTLHNEFPHFTFRFPFLSLSLSSSSSLFLSFFFSFFFFSG
uniref:Transmembrane protein n=1 Tax=Cacopsylla melanoneura TaxID=428564 RepID=A0A8D9B3Z8_9HEMI